MHNKGGFLPCCCLITPGLRKLLALLIINQFQLLSKYIKDTSHQISEFSSDKYLCNIR